MGVIARSATADKEQDFHCAGNIFFRPPTGATWRSALLAAASPSVRAMTRRQGTATQDIHLPLQRYPEHRKADCEPRNAPPKHTLCAPSHDRLFRVGITHSPKSKAAIQRRFQPMTGVQCIANWAAQYARGGLGRGCDGRLPSRDRQVVGHCGHSTCAAAILIAVVT